MAEIDLLDNFKRQVLEVLSEDEQYALGLHKGARQRQWLEEGVNNRKTENVMDNELVFSFAVESDANAVVDFMLEHYLLSENEFDKRVIGGRSALVFSEDVLASKPQVVQAVMEAFQDKLEIKTPEQIEKYNELFDDVNTLIEGNSVMGISKKDGFTGNPYHDKDGRLSGSMDATFTNGGSASHGKVKWKYTGKKRKKDGGMLIRYGSTKQPCGRAAREQGLNIRCWDGKKLGGKTVGRAQGKKVRKESLTVGDIASIVEVRALFENRS